jgi:tetratricopeptide (TPR) repeat protein
VALGLAPRAHAGYRCCNAGRHVSGRAATARTLDAARGSHREQLLPAGCDRPRGGGRNNGNEEWSNYYAALVAYRLSLLAKDNEERSWLAAQRCIDRLNHVLVLDTGSAEALALQSACLALQSRLDPWRSPLAAPLSLARINKALTLAPHNPRVLLLSALASRDRPKFFGGDTGEAFSLLQRSVSAFERQGGQSDGMPGWGAADAFTDLAQDYLARGEAVAARNVLERALLLAPDFAPARRLMAEIVSG